MGRCLALEHAPPASASPDLTAPGGGGSRSPKGPGASCPEALPLPASPSPSAATSLQTRAAHGRDCGPRGSGPCGALRSGLWTARVPAGWGPGAAPRLLEGTSEREAGPPVPPGFVRRAVDLPTVSAERKTTASGEQRGPRLGGECGGRLRRCVSPAVPAEVDTLRCRPHPSEGGSGGPALRGHRSLTTPASHRRPTGPRVSSGAACLARSVGSCSAGPGPGVVRTGASRAGRDCRGSRWRGAGMGAVSRQTRATGAELSAKGS